MKKWKASMQETFEDLPHNVRNWREALRCASQTLDEVWQTASVEHHFRSAGTLLRGNRSDTHGLHAQETSA